MSKNAIDEIIQMTTDYHAKREAREAALQEQIDRVETVLNRGTAAGAGGTARGADRADKVEEWLDIRSGRRVPVLNKGQSLAALDKPDPKAPKCSVGRLLRGIASGSRAPDARELGEERMALGVATDPSGGFTVRGSLAAEWVDMLRAQSVLMEAGVRTVPMDAGEMTIVRVTSDPAVSWHGENDDLPETEPTFGAVRLSARTAVCLVKYSLELSQDAVNLEQQLAQVMTRALAGAIDRAGLVGVTSNAGAAPSASVFGLSGRQVVGSVGSPANWDFAIDGIGKLLTANVPLEQVGAMVGHPNLWTHLRKLKTGISGDQSPLQAPAEVQALPKLWTTAAPTTAAAIGKWDDGLLGIRQEIAIRVLAERFMADKLQVAMLGFVRCDFAAVRPASFVTLEGISLS